MIQHKLPLFTLYQNQKLIVVMWSETWRDVPSMHAHQPAWLVTVCQMLLKMQSTCWSGFSILVACAAAVMVMCDHCKTVYIL